MSAVATFADLRSVADADPKALAIIAKAEGSGGTPGEAALALINHGHGPQGLQIEANWSAQYASSADLQSEFGSEANYIAYRSYEQRKRRR